MPRRGYLDKYVGDAILNDLIRECDNTPYKRRQDYLRRRDKALVAAVFLTGGYVKTVLTLRRRNFDFEDEEAERKNAFCVKDMRVARYRAKRGKPRWVTRTFEIFYDDPLVEYLVDWVNSLPKLDDYLFRVTRHRVWQIIRILGRRMNFSISPMDLRMQRMYYLVEKRGYTIYDLEKYFGMRVPPSIFRRIPMSRKSGQKVRPAALNFPDNIMKRLPKEVKRSIKGVIDIYSLKYPRFCFWGMRTALIDAIRIRFRRDGKEDRLYDDNGNAYKLSKWINFAREERYISMQSARFLKGQIKVFGDTASHDYMADVKKEEIPVIFTQLRMVLARMYYE